MLKWLNEFAKEADLLRQPKIVIMPVCGLLPLAQIIEAELGGRIYNQPPGLGFMYNGIKFEPMNVAEPAQPICVYGA